MKDFTFNMYDELCKTIASSKYETITFEEFFKTKNTLENFIILRHDVDKWPVNALKLAMIESKYNIKTTYFWRNVSHVFKPELIKQQVKLGHEIGYHYETLAQAKGDYEKALSIFQEWLERFRIITNINTICMHGSRFTKWDNRLLWEKFDFKEFDIIGEPYLSINYTDIKYLSDSGGSWLDKGQRTRDAIDDIDNVSVHSSKQIIELINGGKYNKLIILVHPDRWNNSGFIWYYEYVTKKIRNIIKQTYNFFKK